MANTGDANMFFLYVKALFKLMPYKYEVMPYFGDISRSIFRRFWRCDLHKVLKKLSLTTRTIFRRVLSVTMSQ